MLYVLSLKAALHHFLSVIFFFFSLAFTFVLLHKQDVLDTNIFEALDSIQILQPADCLGLHN